MLEGMRVSLRQVNHGLLAAIILINLYIIAAPFWPQLNFWWQSHHGQQKTQLEQLVHTKKSASVSTAFGTDKSNHLIIPAMLLNQPTLEGPESNWFNLLKQGIWRWPQSSTPDKGGNTVFLAHRFSYTGPHGAFYFLNKLRTGDEIGVVWNGKTYTYSVVSSREVQPTETSVEDNTSDARLTLYTCTPLWNPVDRLVVVAKLEKTS